MIRIESIDHLVLTVASLADTCHFYCDVLGMEREIFGEGRIALKFGNQKFNLHQTGSDITPKAKTPMPGSADLCLITSVLIPQVISHLEDHNIDIEIGPVKRTGANGAITSVYVRDPDGNLLEISNYD